jgi:hypothetical protein
MNSVMQIVAVLLALTTMATAPSPCSEACENGCKRCGVQSPIHPPVVKTDFGGKPNGILGRR